MCSSYPPSDDQWAIQVIGNPFPKNPVRIVGQQNMYIAFCHKHGIPIYGRAWNNGGIVECSFPFGDLELNSANELGQIQILQYKGDHRSLGFWYNWVKYKDRFEQADRREFVRYENWLPVLWATRPGGALFGCLDEATSVAYFSHDNIVEKLFGKEIDDLMMIIRELDGAPPNCECQECEAKRFMSTTARVMLHEWADFNFGEPFPSRKLVKALDRALDTVDGEKKEQYVALWFKSDEPVLGRVWEEDGRVAASFSCNGIEYCSNLGTLQILCQLSDTIRGFDYCWRQLPEAATLTDDEWQAVQIYHHNGSVGAAVLIVEGKELLGKIDFCQMNGSVGVGGVERVLVGADLYSSRVLCCNMMSLSKFNFHLFLLKIFAENRTFYSSLDYLGLPPTPSLSFSSQLTPTSVNRPQQLPIGSSLSVSRTASLQNYRQNALQERQLCDTAYGTASVNANANNTPLRVPTLNGATIVNGIDLAKLKFVKPAPQCYHWENRRHRIEQPNCQLWHPHELCKYYPKCTLTAEVCGFGHPFCGDYCVCEPTKRSLQKNHYLRNAHFQQRDIDDGMESKVNSASYLPILFPPLSPRFPTLSPSSQLTSEQKPTFLLKPPPSSPMTVMPTANHLKLPLQLSLPSSRSSTHQLLAPRIQDASTSIQLEQDSITIPSLRTERVETDGDNDGATSPKIEADDVGDGNPSVTVDRTSAASVDYVRAKTLNGATVINGINLLNLKFVKPAPQCFHWENRRHRLEQPNCRLWHPRELCKYYPKCTLSAEVCGFGHPFCGDVCVCVPSQRSLQKNHYILPTHLNSQILQNQQQPQIAESNEIAKGSLRQP